MVFEIPLPQPDYDHVVIGRDVCDIFDRPEDFDGKLVAVSGHFLTDWRHGALIFDYTCRKGIWFDGVDEQLGETWTLIQNTRDTPEAESISLSVVGRFEWNPDAPGLYARTKVLYVEAIETLVIETP